MQGSLKLEAGNGYLIGVGWCLLSRMIHTILKMATILNYDFCIFSLILIFFMIFTVQFIVTCFESLLILEIYFQSSSSESSILFSQSHLHNNGYIGPDKEILFA